MPFDPQRGGGVDRQFIQRDRLAFCLAREEAKFKDCDIRRPVGLIGAPTGRLSGRLGIQLVDPKNGHYDILIETFEFPSIGATGRDIRRSGSSAASAQVCEWADLCQPPS
jgi:hypothetical protein